MLENIVRHIENGETPFEAALNGSKEIGFTIVTMTAVAGRGLHPDPVHGRHSGTAVPRVCRHHHGGGADFRRACRLRLTPMLCSRFLRVGAHQEGLRRPHGQGLRCTLCRGYKWSLGIVLRHRLAMLVVFVGCPRGHREDARIVPKGFIPDQDNDSMNIQHRARRRARRSMRWPRRRSRSPKSSARIRTSTASWPRLAAGETGPTTP